MANPVSQRSITPSKVTAWLDCAHFLTLKHQVEDGLLAAPALGFGSFAQLLADKGLEHEGACLAEYEAGGARVLRVPPRNERETFDAWSARVAHHLDEDHGVLYQMPLVSDGIRGIADFLVRAPAADGQAAWEPVDSKLTRVEAKPGHVLQLCFYAEAIAAATGTRPARMHLWLGSGVLESLLVEDFAAYWRRLRVQLDDVLDDQRLFAQTIPQPCAHCEFCEFAGLCDAQWRESDSLIYVTGLRATERETLEDTGISTLTELAGQLEPVPGLNPERQERLVSQAGLQLQARDAEGGAPPYLMLAPGADPVWGHGLEQLPEPDAGDVFLDLEGHPFWRADRGLFFLFGLLEHDGQTLRYVPCWAHDPDGEASASAALIEHIAARRLTHPAMHVYHYNHTERSALQRLAAEHGVGEAQLHELVDTGAFVDLLAVARNAVQVGTESYGLKALERLTDYERGHQIDQGAAAVVEYEKHLDGDTGALDRIAAYNRDDVSATLALRDWLVSQRPADLPWRAAVLEGEEQHPELDEQVAALHAYGPGTLEHLLGDVLEYWRREWRAHLAPLLARAAADTQLLLPDPETLAGLTCLGERERLGANGKQLTPSMAFAFPEQDLTGLGNGDQVVYTMPEGHTGYASILVLDHVAGEVVVSWSKRSIELSHLPVRLVRNDWVRPQPKPEALGALAPAVLSAGQPNPVAMALLARALPAFLDAGGPPDARFTDDLDEMLAWSTELDGSLVAVQGPPGTGKTFRGAHLVHALVMAGKRVGVTAMSHAAITNLLDAVCEVFEHAGHTEHLRAVRKVPGSVTDSYAHITHATANKAAAKSGFNVVAGTTWLFAGPDMIAAPVDVLLVDEAGQLCLADALAAARSARNLILLGDPSQLAQVAQATHPNGSGASVLEHVLGPDITLPPERGVFLAQTRRMHPDITEFISSEFYEGRLTSHPDCANQSTSLGTGLRWLRASHTGRVSHAIEEVDVVVTEVIRLLGSSWTDQQGRTAPIGDRDILVVAPYNDQVDLLRERLDADPGTRGIAVGTVDKFQGRQAAVVIFTMTTSSAADMKRSADFLFSRNRLNVAVSRAQCLAYLVCTEELLNARGRDVDEMRLISSLCAFVERCE